MDRHEWTVGPVDLAGIGPNDHDWLAQFQPAHRWNGWIGFPYFDALTAVEILDFVNDGNDDYYGTDWYFDAEGNLVLEDRQFRTEYPEDFAPEVIAPDEDGLYSVGAYSWVWSER